MCSNQHGYVRKRSVLTNILFFLKQIFEAIDHSVDNEVFASYTDFSKAFHRVSDYELLKKVGNIRVGGCILEMLFDYLTEKKQYVRLENFKSDELEVTSDIPQGFRLGSLLFCVFTNYLSDVLKFSETYIFAEDLKIFFLYSF